jgi:mRNA interferase YafQ
LRRIVTSSRFQKDVKRISKRGLDLNRLGSAIDTLQRSGEAPSGTRPHLLIGAWSGHLECHIAPDWLLIYQVDESEVRLYRTGTHSDLFG